MSSSIIFLSLLLVLGVATALDLDYHWCSSCDDPHMHTFDGTNYEFQFSGNFFLMYTNYASTRVTASFRRCNPGNPTPTCNCGVHVRYLNAILFLDTCGILPNPFNGLQFFYVSTSNLIPQPANCGSKTVPGGSETDDSWWNTAGNAVNILTNKFLCAKSQSLYNTYIIRTNNADMNENIYLKVMVHDRGITCIYIRPSANAFGNSGGLCGTFNGNPADDLSIWTPGSVPGDGSANSGYDSTIATEAQMSQFWQLDINAPDELSYKKLDEATCPCDTGNEPLLSNSSCSVLLSECLQLSINEKFTYQDSITATQGRPMNKEKALDRCNEIFKMGKLEETVAQKLNSQDQLELLRELCAIDLAGTGDNLWAVNLVQLAYNWALETCLTTPAAMCDELKIPAKCSLSSLGSLVNDGAATFPCPTDNRCTKK